MSALLARTLVHMIGLFTNLAFYGRLSTEFVSPAGNRLGLLVVLVPVAGGVIVGLMARFGSKAIRGHGIPEAMEQVLTNQSRIPARITFLKPLSAAVAIGTGGPFGAEGPIIATGGALGSLIGQVMSTAAIERKTLLAAGAASGMAATFNSPISAVILAVELLLFEFRPRSIIPVALASTTATAMRMLFEGSGPVFAVSDLQNPAGTAMAVYVFIGALTGIMAAGVTRSVYFVEDAFERLPIHWMWWPAIGAVAVGVAGYFAPRTLGVGYDNISDILSNHLGLGMVAWLCAMKFVSWSISLGSGTSGGTLAPLCTIGSGFGALLGAAAHWLVPFAHVDIRLAAMVGMAALFAAASRALLASVVFAFETTLQPAALLPLLGGCAAAYLVSCLLMRHTIMTEKIARRGVRVPAEYTADLLDQVLVREVATQKAVVLQAEHCVESVRAWMTSSETGSGHQGFPVVNCAGDLIGVLTRRDLLDARVPGDRAVGSLVRRPPIVVYVDCSLKEAVDHMVNHDVGRLPVVSRDSQVRIMGIITRSDILSAYRRRLEETRRAIPIVSLSISRLRNKPASASR
jgi:H+/Cl- antiporter ClcA